MPRAVERTFDLKVPELQETLRGCAAYYSPDEVREIVCALFTGQNYRGLTEKPTRQAISVFGGWLLNVAHRASLIFGEEWQENLLVSVSRKGASQPEKWLKFWLLGLTQKTAVNLGIKSHMHQDYQRRVRASTREMAQQLGWLSGARSEKRYTPGLSLGYTNL